MKYPGQANLTVKLDDEDLALLEQLLAREKLTKSEFVRRMIRKTARDAGLVPPGTRSIL